MNINLPKVLALSLMVISTSFLSHANAGSDEKTAPGSACTAYSGQHQASLKTYRNWTYFDAKKSSNRSQWITCPIIEDTMAGGKKHNFNVNVYLYHPSHRKTTCYFNRVDVGGSGAGSSVGKSTTGVGHRIIKFSVGSSYNKQTSSIHCKLADGPRTVKHHGATVLKNYHWEEQ